MSQLYTTPILYAEDLINFFGCPLDRVNYFLLRIAMEDRPEWLRGKTKLTQLPRWTENCPNTLPVGNRRIHETCSCLIWMVEEIQGGWKLTHEFCFDDYNEMILFKLRWG